jgi:NADPH-dependent 2,4-dienoyl-CoA reductase/sulfur reductase-like enzyme
MSRSPTGAQAPTGRRPRRRVYEPDARAGSLISEISVLETITTEVLVVGAGAAGIRAALAASEAEANVLMVSKGQLTRSGSTFSSISVG